MSRVTPRIKQSYNMKDMIGKILTSNMFPTLKGRLLYVWEGKCFFEIQPNPEYEKYNGCAGQVEYLPESIVITMNFEED